MKASSPKNLYLNDSNVFPEVQQKSLFRSLVGKTSRPLKNFLTFSYGLDRNAKTQSTGWTLRIISGEGGE
jgi:hypothetical protein